MCWVGLVWVGCMGLVVGGCWTRTCAWFGWMCGGRERRAQSAVALIPPRPPNKPKQELAGLVQGIQEVEEMFSMNIVQGKLNQEGNYEVRLRPDVHLKDKEHEMVTHVDDRLVGDTVVVDHSKAPTEGGGGGCCGGGCGEATPQKA